MQIFGPPGWDSNVLNLALQMQQLFGEFPAPPTPSICAGCTANVTAIPVSLCLPHQGLAKAGLSCIHLSDVCQCTSQA